MKGRSALTFIPSRQKAQSGFSLLELSVVMIIMALVLSALLSLGTRSTTESKRDITQQRLETVRRAIGLYASTYHALPCPAAANAAPKTTNYGRAQNPTTCAGATATTPAGGYTGAVPVVSLGLSDEYMLDGWNRRITYMVDADFIRQRDLDAVTTALQRGGLDDLDSDPADQNALQSINVYPIVGGTVAYTAAIALISHGPNGHGAFPLSGGSAANILPSNSNVYDNEWENAGRTNSAPTADTLTHDLNIVQTTESAVTTANNSAFDDLVLTLSRSEAIEFAGGIIDQPTCEMLFYANQAINETAAVPQGPVGCTSSPGTTAPSFTCIERQVAMSKPLLELCFITDPN